MLADCIKDIRKKLKETSPLIHCITNPISINQCANLILASDCRPVMAEHPKEVSGITETSSALLVNLGNITDTRMKSIRISAKTAQKNHIPAVLDCAGTACSELRRRFALHILKKYRISVIKGNYSEIKALHNKRYKCSGVDAEPSLDVAEISRISADLAAEYKCIVMASGQADIITNGKKIIKVRNGCRQMASVTGTGCMLGALTACYLSAGADIYSAAAACAVFGICGEMARDSSGNGSFMTKLADCLSVVTDCRIEEYIQTEENEVEKI